MFPPRSSVITRSLLGLFTLAGSLLSAQTDFVEAVRQDTATLAASSRITGSEGHARATAWLGKELGALPGARTWKQEFQVLMPVVNKATLTLSSGPFAGEHPVYPLWPDMVRLNSTDADGITGNVLYVADGSLAELPASSLRGNIAAMEMSAYKNWKRPFSLNVSALLLLGSPEDQALPPASQPLYFPRYYIPDGPLADEIRRNGLPESTVTADLEWKEVTATNHLALILPEAPSDLPAIGLAAAYDAMSIVMDQAPGADNAVDAAFLLNLAKETAASGTSRPVLFAFLDAVSINQLGTRQFLSMLSTVEEDTIRVEYAEKDAEMLADYQETAEAYASLGTGRDALENMYDKRAYRDIQRAYKDAVGPELLDTKEEAAELRLRITKTEGGEQAELKAALAVKTQRIATLNRILEQVLTDLPISDELLPEATRILEQAGRRINQQLKAQQERSNPYAANDILRNELLAAMDKPTGTSPIHFLVGVDLSDAGHTVGAGLIGAHLKQDLSSQARDLTRWLKQALVTPSQTFDTSEQALLETTLNQATLSGSEHPKSFNLGESALLTSPAGSFNLPSVTWKTLSGLPTKLDTPQDSLERLRWDRLDPQIQASRTVLTALIHDAAFAPPQPLDSAGVASWRRPWGSIVRESVAETVPRTPMPGFLISLVPVGDATDPAPLYGARGIRRQEFVLSQADGGFSFFPTPGGVPRGLANNNVYAYKLNDAGEIIFAKSDVTSIISGQMSSTFDVNSGTNRTPARLLAFPAQEVNGPTFFDPRFLEPLNNYSLIDPMTGGQHKQSQFTVVEGQMWGALRPDATWQLILRAGTAANRMILMNLDPELPNNPDMKPQDAMRNGFEPGEPLPSFPAHIAAQDFYIIDSWRLENFNRAGITSEVLSELHDKTGELLEQVDQAMAEDQGEKAGMLAVAALANELRVYEALLATGSDVTRGAIFLMILIVPFAVAMERLMFAFVKIHHRISCSFGIFTLMALLLWSFHPAFRITNQPIVIVMAFAILLLSLLVIIMIFRKFENDLEDMRSGSAEKGGAQTTRGGVIGSAIWLGIANMRKRKLRTFLTAITIVLITFALLAFSSSTTYQNQRRFPVTDVAPPYSGILLKNPGMGIMHENALTMITSLADGMDVAPRYWWTESKLPTWRIQARNLETGSQSSFKAALGLSGLESGLTGPDRFLSGWDVFAAGRGAYLSEARAAEMGLTAGDALTVGGQELVLAGTFSNQIEQQLTMLDGQSMLPFDFTIESDTESSAQAGQGGSAVIGEEEGDKLRVPPDDLILLPARLVRELGGDLRSIALPTASHEETLVQVEALSKILAFPLYYGTAENTSVVAATPLIPQVPRNLITPLVLAALIIFNTMLNSVAERKKEIHIYTSLGLAPMHVGMLFLSEAVTYGLMGSVFGYIAGQGFAAVLTSFDLMGGITLNYSGSSVITTMGLVIGVVVLSSLVPAIMAGKLASPSDEMKWVVPDPVDGVIKDQLPFTIHRDAAPGLMAFVHEYVVAHEEGTIGHFASADTRLLPPDETTVTGLTGTLWLAPYDLGVRQKFALRVMPDPEETDEICLITIEIIHEAGQPGTWWRQNRTFLGDLRKQLLGWRKVPADRILEYIDQFNTLHLSTSPQA